MMLKEIGKDIYDVDAWLDEGLGKEGSPEREKNREKAWKEYNAVKNRVKGQPFTRNLPSDKGSREKVKGREEKT